MRREVHTLASKRVKSPRAPDRGGSRQAEQYRVLARLTAELAGLTNPDQVSRELVRGIDISGTPLVALQSIRAASREIETFNGICGAESGWVPVSASAPSLLIEKLEVERSFTPPDRPPVLNPPALRTAGGAQ